jgi:hypothetical protein
VQQAAGTAALLEPPQALLMMMWPLLQALQGWLLLLHP